MIRSSQYNIVLTSIVAFLLITLPQSAVSQTSTATECEAAKRKSLSFTAADKSGGVISSLGKNDLTLKIADKLVQIFDVSMQADRPYDIAILIDTSLSQEEALPQVRNAAKGLVAAVMKNGTNRVALVSFSNEPRYDQALTLDAQAVVSAINGLRIDIPPGYIGGGMVVSSRPPAVIKRMPGSTALWDTASEAVSGVFTSAGTDRQHAIVVFTDGQDTSSSGTLRNLIENCLRQNIIVYAIGTTTSYGGSEGSLKKLGEETGGVAKFPKKKNDYESVSNEIVTRLRTQYRIEYCVSEVSGKVRVEVVNPDLKKLQTVVAYKRVLQ